MSKFLYTYIFVSFVNANKKPALLHAGLHRKNQPLKLERENLSLIGRQHATNGQ